MITKKMVMAFGNVLEDIIEWISGNLAPDDVFSDKDLEDRAENHGWEERLDR